MKKRNKLYTAALAAVVAVGTMCSAFALWSSDVTLNGNVAANGKWDVNITAADIEVEGGVLKAAAPVYELTTYNVYLKDNGRGTLLYEIDDTASTKTVVTEKDLGNYSRSLMITRTSSAYRSGTNPGCIMHYKFYSNGVLPDEDYDVLRGLVSYYKGENENAVDGLLIGSAIGWYYDTGASASLENEALTLDYKNAEAYFADNQVSDDAEVKTAEIVNDGETANFAAVELNIPGAWANYKVTITNNGSVNANLKDCDFDVTDLEESIYEVRIPEIPENEVLEPGESCTFNFVVVVDTTENEITSDGIPFSVTLKYVQDEVKEAPEAVHTMH